MILAKLWEKGKVTRILDLTLWLSLANNKKLFTKYAKHKPIEDHIRRNGRKDEESI